MNVWFTSDHHFGHANIIAHCKRPFRDTAEMEETMIARWNEVVAKGDRVYYLGDLFSFKPREMDLDHARSIRMQLNGDITLVRGNHDVQPWLFDVMYAPPLMQINYLTIKADGRHVVLFHYPIESWDGMHHGAVHLHGHSHGQLSRRIRNRFDVGVDCHGFKPVSLGHLLETQGA